MKGGDGATGDSVLVTAQFEFIVPVGGTQTHVARCANIFNEKLEIIFVFFFH